LGITLERCQRVEDANDGAGRASLLLSQPVVGKSLLTPHAGGWVCPISQVGRQHTGIDTTDIRPLSQPWMYLFLLGFALLLLLTDGWVIWTALNLGKI
jgi:hypothetical protein